MRKFTAIILCMLLVLCLAFPMQVYAAPSFSLSTSAKTVKSGGSFTAYVKGIECVGRVNISVSNGSAAQSAVWVENNSVSVKITAGQSGKVTVTATPEPGMSDMEANEINPGSRSATVTITSASSGGSGSSSKPSSGSTAENTSQYKVGDIESAVYSGSEIKPTVSVTYDGKTLKEGTDYEVAYDNNINAGTAKVTVTGKGSHDFSLTKTFEITPKDLADIKVESIDTQNFTGGFVEPGVVIKNGDVELAEGEDYTLTYENNIAEGTATVTIAGAGNYKGSISTTFEIVEKLFDGNCKMHIIIPVVALIGAIAVFIMRRKEYADIMTFTLVGVVATVAALKGGCEGDWVLGMVSMIVLGAEALIVKMLNEKE